MRLLLVAPPGAGKGTQATLLSSHYGIVHLSSGDLLREEVAAGTEIGRVAADYLGRGDLVPDELVIEVLAVHIFEAAHKGGYVLDGFPRTRTQAEEAYRVATQIDGVELQAVIHLMVSREELLRRIGARATTEGRNDDTRSVFVHRLAVFDDETEPLLGFYAERGLVVHINGEQPPDKVFADIVMSVDGLSR
jgi:adenylate kinase